MYSSDFTILITILDGYGFAEVASQFLCKQKCIKYNSNIIKKHYCGYKFGN